MRWALMAVGLIGLAGCGFSPMYAQRFAANPQADLAAIDIAPVRDRAGRRNRAGQELRAHLDDRLRPAGQGVPALYRLAITLNRSSAALAIQLDDKVTRYNLTASARISLADLRSGGTIFASTVRAVSSYDVVSSPFATVAAEQDAGRRAVRAVGDEIATRLSVFFSRRHQRANNRPPAP